MPPPRKASRGKNVVIEPTEILSLRCYREWCHLSQGTKFAFTLAEVLITLGIIGIIAALIIPTYTQNQKNKATAAKLKKTYSTIENALKMAEAEHGPMNNWDLADSTNFTKNYIAPYVQYYAYYQKNSHDSNSAMCIASPSEAKKIYICMNGVGMSYPVSEHTSSIKLSNGACIGFNNLTTNNKLLYIDINGNENPPNTAGKDLFIYYFDKNYFIKPVGNNLNLSDDDLINPSTTYACNKKSSGGGYYCAEKIMRDNWEIKY